MKIEVDITKKRFFILLGAILVVSGMFFVYAYGGNNPPVMGHTPGEIEWSVGIGLDPLIKNDGPHVTFENTGSGGSIWTSGVQSGDGDFFVKRTGEDNAAFIVKPSYRNGVPLVIDNSGVDIDRLCLDGVCETRWPSIKVSVGGGYEVTNGCETEWGFARCNNRNLVCDEGTKTFVGRRGAGQDYYVCVKDL